MTTAIGLVCLLGLTAASILGNLLLWTEIRGKFHKMHVEREELAIERMRAESELQQLRESPGDERRLAPEGSNLHAS